MPVVMAFNDEQLRFFELLAQRIPLLFNAIGAGNIKSEFIIGTRRIGQHQVQLKIVAEVVDPGANPLKTHGMAAPVTLSVEAEVILDDN